MGLFNIDGVVEWAEGVDSPKGAFARLRESSMGKDTTIGHWEMAGLISEKPFPTYPNGFPDDVLTEFVRQTGRGVLCNKPYSGTEVIKDYGVEHMETGDLIVYTSADSVFQIAAHEDIVPVDELYRYCEIARKILVEDNTLSCLMQYTQYITLSLWQFNTGTVTTSETGFADAHLLALQTG